MKFAYLIMAHNNFEILKELIKALDAPENDLYIHIDRKLGEMDYKPFLKLTKYSKVIFIKNRVSVSWGRVSIISATLNLLEESAKGNYDYYHLLSGVDFPIKSNKYILNFFIKNNGKEFVGILDNWDSVIQTRVSYYHMIDGNLERKSVYARRLSAKLLSIQRKLHIYNHYPSDEFRGGPAWFSITNDLAIELLREKKTILSKYKFVEIPDEIFIQTFVHHRPKYYERVYNHEDAYIGCLRKVDWTRGGPYTWQSGDYEELTSCPHLWARKFSENDMDIIKRLVKYIKS